MNIVMDKMNISTTHTTTIEFISFDDEDRLSSNLYGLYEEINLRLLVAKQRVMWIIGVIRIVQSVQSISIRRC